MLKGISNCDPLKYIVNFRYTNVEKEYQIVTLKYIVNFRYTNVDNVFQGMTISHLRIHCIQV